MANQFPIFWLAPEEPASEDVELWIGDDEFILVSQDTTLEMLAREAEVFGSSSQARRAGLCGEVPIGLEAWGTKKKRFWTINPGGDFSTPLADLNKTEKMLG